jgi:hypothetical protein
MTTPDLLYLALIAIGLLVDHFVLWPVFLRWSQVNPGRARRWLWSSLMILLWALVACGVALWLFEARAWKALRLVIPQGWRLWSALGLIVLVAIIYGRSAIRISRSKRVKRIEMGSPHVEKLAPHSRSELGWWAAVSVSAGVCEEFIFRGYLLWAFQPLFGLWGAALFSIVVFAAAHAYQGANGILATGVVGALLTLVVLICGSLWAAIALHTLIDLGTGLVAFLALRKMESDSNAVFC